MVSTVTHFMVYKRYFNLKISNGYNEYQSQKYVSKNALMRSVDTHSYISLLSKNSGPNQISYVFNLLLVFYCI